MIIRPLPFSVLISPDKFKGTLTAAEAAEAISRGWKKARPSDSLTIQPISDGGDGFGKLLSPMLNADKQYGNAPNPAGSLVKYSWWLNADKGTAIVESAEIIGLAALMQRGPAPSPMQMDTKGIGRALIKIINGQEPPTEIIVGIGGSATNDGGFGMARELGWLFLDKQNQELTCWTDLSRLESLRTPNPEIWSSGADPAITVAVDVQNPLLGPNGCTRVYGPQKGLQKKDISSAEAALTRLAEVWKMQTGEDAASIPGAGAAGGLGFGMHCFAGARIRPGFEIFAKAAKLETLIQETDLIITGEGQMDKQSMMGKGVGELVKMAQEQDRPCIALAGTINDHDVLENQIGTCRAITELTSVPEAMARAAYWLEKLAHEAARYWRPHESQVT